MPAVRCGFLTRRTEARAAVEAADFTAHRLNIPYCSILRLGSCSCVSVHTASGAEVEMMLIITGTHTFGKAVVWLRLFVHSEIDLASIHVTFLQWAYCGTLPPTSHISDIPSIALQRSDHTYLVVKLFIPPPPLPTHLHPWSTV